jgi:nucleoporin NUP159
MGAAKPSIWGSSGTNALKSGADSPFAPGKTGVQPTPFTGFANKTSAFGTAASPSASPFATAGNADGKNAFAAVGTSGQLGGFGKASAPTLSNENSMGSTATIGTTPFSSFGKFGSGSSGLSREATMGGEENASPPFKLVSGFKGDGSAKDDLPKPENPGAGMFGENFLSGTESKKPAAPSPFIKPEPGTEKQPSLKDIPQKQEVVPEDAPLPPDPSTNPSKYKMPDDMPLPPDFTTTKPKEEVDDDLPIAGSPPVNVTNSQTLSSGGPSDGPSDDDGSGFESEDEDDDGEEASDEEEDDSQEQFSEGASEDWAPANDETNDPEFSNNIKSYINHSTTPAKKLGKTSYTPAGLPKGPTFPPPQNRPTLSPRSPSPHRAVTAPIAQNSTFKPLPSQIKTTSIPPAKLVERPAAAPKEPRQPTAGELEDQAADRVKATLSQPPVPSKQLPTFYTHQDYAGTVDKPGVGGQIETVYRDVNSMIDVLGLNARSLEEFLEGHVQLRKPGSRVREDLEEDVVWCLGDVADIGRITNDIGMQLQEGQLEHVPALLADLGEQQKAILQLKAKTAEMRKHLVVRTDPEKLAMQAAAPLSAELQAQQAELRQGVQTIQGLLTDVENKLALLRADLAAARLQEGQKGPVPTVEAVTKTIIKMTAMVEQRSGDIDLLESQIKRLPNGIASLRLGDTYEDDLVSALGGSKLLTGSPSRSTPPRRRMAANGDPLGMSGMFGTSQSGGLRGSRFQTPPSSMRRSVAFTPEASAFGRSTGSLSGSTRKKMGDVTVEQVEAFQARKGRRRAVLGEFKRAVEKGGPRITATY